MIGLSFSLLLLLTILQMISYYFYNGRFHPYALIVMPNREQADLAFADADEQNDTNQDDNQQDEELSDQESRRNMDFRPLPDMDHETTSQMESTI